MKESLLLAKNPGVQVAMIAKVYGKVTRLSLKALVSPHHQQDFLRSLSFSPFSIIPLCLKHHSSSSL